MKHLATLLSALSIATTAAAAPTTVFSSKFDGSMPPQISPGTATLEGVQGYAGLGNGKNKFSGNFLRSEDANVVTLTLTDLPTHGHLTIKFLFAAIDSLDGSGRQCPEGDYFMVKIDDRKIFRESFANATSDQTQSYDPPPGGELARRADLGFTEGGFYFDSAYDMRVEPKFQRIKHTASTAVITFVMDVLCFQPLDDESWAIDNLVVTAGW